MECRIVVSAPRTHRRAARPLAAVCRQSDRPEPIFQTSGALRRAESARPTASPVVQFPSGICSPQRFSKDWACRKIAILYKHMLHRKPPLCKGRWPGGPEGLCAGSSCQHRPLSHALRDSSPYAGEPWCGCLLCMLRILRQAPFAAVFRSVQSSSSTAPSSIRRPAP